MKGLDSWVAIVCWVPGAVVISRDFVNKRAGRSDISDHKGDLPGFLLTHIAYNCNRSTTYQ